MPLEVQGESPQGLDRTEKGVIVGSVACLFAFDCVLLVGKLQGSMGDAMDVSFI